MGNFIYKIGGTGTTLNKSEQDNNVKCVFDELNGKHGFSLAAVCGAVGCFYEESSMNPGIYETSHGGNLNNLPYFPGGMGLAQWTDYPAYTAQYPNPLPWSAQKEGKNWWDGEFQCWLLTKCDVTEYTAMGYGQGPRWGWQTSSNYPSISFPAYKKLADITDAGIRQAVAYWFYCLEWHAAGIPEWVNFEERVRKGIYARDLLAGYQPQPGGKNGMPLYFYLKNFL